MRRAALPPVSPGAFKKLATAFDQVDRDATSTFSVAYELKAINVLNYHRLHLSLFSTPPRRSSGGKQPPFRCLAVPFHRIGMIPGYSSAPKIEASKQVLGIQTA